jgi:hypothetical protein
VLSLLLSKLGSDASHASEALLRITNSKSDGYCVIVCKLTHYPSIAVCAALASLLRCPCAHQTADPETLEPVTPTEEPETAAPTSSRKLTALCTPFNKDAVVVLAVRFYS